MSLPVRAMRTIVGVMLKELIVGHVWPTPPVAEGGMKSVNDRRHLWHDHGLCSALVLASTQNAPAIGWKLVLVRKWCWTVSGSSGWSANGSRLATARGSGVSAGSWLCHLLLKGRGGF
eukprot:213910-Amphidinium_carterae.1